MVSLNYWMTPSFTSYLLSSYHVPGTLLYTEDDASMNKETMASKNLESEKEEDTAP